MEKNSDVNRNVRENFFYGSVVRRKIVSGDGVRKACVYCLYNTIAYKDNDDFYYDFLSGKQIPFFYSLESANSQEEIVYFAGLNKVFEKSPRKRLNKNEREFISKELVELFQQAVTDETNTINFVRSLK